ncbi:hypothetical protein ANCCAN_23859 [Ancylostoma caninum]|uniref:Amiloride-sensitive sodium channel n=1 Tax=Ancylostoma caninum TaxID=29170 RepID=A0A368FJN3_ANCCA|nr:hypothetical protein ANCCAN_23859 [Ancylostoma caninum]
MALPPRSVSPTNRKYTLGEFFTPLFAPSINEMGKKSLPDASLAVDTGSGVLELESEKNDLFDIIQEANMDGVRHLKADDALSRHVFTGIELQDYMFVQNFSRYIWCFIIVIFVILALIQIYYQIMLFYSEPVATNIEVEYPSTIAFPTVAICNNNQFR